MKEIINIIIGNEDISILDKYESNNKEVFERYKKIVKILITKCKRYYNSGLKLEQLIELVKTFYNEYNQNVILKGYYEHNLNEDKIEEEITNILERIINKMNISLTNDVDNAFKTSGKVDSKKLTLSNGHPDYTETGFISPIILAILTATIEITTLLYIFLNTME